MTNPTTASPRQGTTTDRGLARGARWLTAGALLVGAINYGYAFAMTRLLSTSGYSHFAAGQALLLTAGTISAVSVPWVLAQELIRSCDDRDQRRRAVRFASVTNLGQGTLVGVAVGLIAGTFSSLATSATIAVSALLIFLASTSLGWYQAAQRFRAIAARGVADVVAKAVSGCALVGIGVGAGGALAGFGVGAFVIFAAGVWMMRDEYGVVVDAFGSRELWLSTGGVTGIQGLVAVLTSIDVVLVDVLHVAPAAAASYQASIILARIPMFLAGAVAAAAFPMLRSAGAMPGRLLRISTKIYLGVSIPLAIVLGTAPAVVLRPLFPGGFDEVGRLLPLTAVAGVLLGLVELLTTFFQAGGHYRRCIRNEIIGVICTLVGVPIGWGAWGVIGIAVAACAGAGVTVALLVLDARRLWPGSELLHPVRALLFVVLGLALLSLRAYSLIWLVASAAALAASGCIAFLTAPSSSTVGAHRA